MMKVKFLLLTLLSVLGMNTAWAETVSPYKVDFNKTISTGIHDFAVASNWEHFVPKSDYDGMGPYYMNYAYYADQGIGGSGTLLCNKQYAGDYGGGEVVKDILVTPVVSGTLTLHVKPSSLASNSNPSFVEFYKQENATQAGEIIKRFTVDDAANPYVLDPENEGWYTVSITLDKAQRIGIRGQYVYLDDFSASSAEVVLENKLTVTKLSQVGTGTYYPAQKEDGSVDISLKVTLRNDGDFDLKKGDENYTLNLVKREYYSSGVTVIDDAVFQIEEELPVGKEVTFTANFNTSSLGTGWMYLKVQENISGTISSPMVQTQVMPYESGFIFNKEGSTSNSSTSTPIAFGMVSEATTLNYQIYNPGPAPVTINSLTIDAPFTTDAPAGEFTVNGGETKVIAISFPAAEIGIFDGNLTIQYTNFGKEAATYSLAVSATVLDPSKNIITFDNGKTGTEANGQYPAGSIHPSKVYITYSTDDNGTNYYLQSADASTKFITPLLTAKAGETFSFDAWYKEYNETAKVIVYCSKDREEWTQLTEVGYKALSVNKQPFFATIEEAGDYYLAFELAGNALLDNIYGLVLAPQPEHNWYVTGTDLPTTAKENSPYTATISVKNINAEADVIETAILYLDGETVDVKNDVALEGNPMTAVEGTYSKDNIANPLVITFTFNPHTSGEHTAYIELMSDYKVVTTGEVTINIAKEVASSELVIGENSYPSTQVPFHTTWMDDSSGKSMSDFVYSKEELEKFGLQAGDKVTAITFKGVPTSSKTIDFLTAEAWLGTMDDPSTFVAGEVDKESMTHFVIFNEEKVETFEDVEMEFKLDLSNDPFVWDGKSAIRIYTNIHGHDINGKGQYVNIKFPVDKNYKGYYTYRTNSWSSGASPVAYFSLAVTERFVKGLVTDSNTGQPIKGVSVTVCNDENDVEYSGVTDEEGKYSINVVQDKLTYNLTADAEGYEDYKQEGLAFAAEGNVVCDFEMTPIFTTEEVTISESTYATLYYENENLQAPEGVTVYTVAIVGNKAQLSKIESGIIPAGVAVVLNGEAGSYEFTVLNEIEPEAKDVTSDLIGTEEDASFSSDDNYYYILSWKDAQKNIDEVGFYWQQGTQGKSATLRAHQGYICLPQAMGAGFCFTFDEETGINTVERAAINEADAIYNLSGVRVNASQMRKGVYVVNGKKVVIK